MDLKYMPITIYIIYSSPIYREGRYLYIISSRPDCSQIIQTVLSLF